MNAKTQAILIKQGAEARVYKLPFLSNESAIVKERLKKAYRHPDLDEKITKQRINQEARCLARCKKGGIDTPTVLLVDHPNRSIYMDFIQGPSLRDYIDTLEIDGEEYMQIALKIGDIVAKVHDLDIIHGDLTTSNILIRENTKGLVLIDFGLSLMSKLIEDKAVDLYVLERALTSTHLKSEKLFEHVLQSYEHSSRNGKIVLKKFEDVRRRGRKRTEA